MARFKEMYVNDVAPALMKKYQYKSVMQIPKIDKVVINCGCGEARDNSKVIDAFKNNKLDVLVNVNIMTEGSDVPDIQTVFLTRPTQSEGLLMQMIGRGMRGKQAHGTETANIVDFHDQWSTYNKWLNPEWIVCDEISDEETPEMAR